jgi:putative chitinase
MKHLKSIDEFLNEQLFGNTTAQFLDLLGFGNPGDIKNPQPSVVGGNVKFSGSGDKAKNIQILIETMKKHGITNPYTQIAILGVIGKESNYIPKIEKGYGGTSPERIRKIFGSRVSDLTDEQINQIKVDDEKFFDLVYGPGDKTGKSQKYGNSSPGDGWKYRGRGFNQLTFKGSYEKMQKILDTKGKLGRQVNIVTNPEILDDPEVAAEISVLFFLSRATSPQMAQKFGVSDINAFKDQFTATKAMTNANAGWGNDVTNDEGFMDAQKYASNFVVDTTGSASMA